MEYKSVLPLWCLLSLMALVRPCLAQDSEVIVPDDYNTIQAAIDALESDPLLGDTIIVEPGEYTESLEMASNLTLMGRETARTIINPGFSPFAINVNLLIDVNIRNLTITGGDVGVLVSNSTNVSLSNLVFETEFGDAIQVNDNSIVTISNSVFHNNDIGITRNSVLTEIENNLFVGNALAINSNTLDDNIRYNGFFDNNDDGQTGEQALLNLDPLFVDAALLDFHLRNGSPAIDAGLGTDVIDDSTADLGAYGGADADTIPFPVQNVTVSEVTDQQGSFAVQLNWSANEDYRIDNDAGALSYFVHYDSDASGPPYDGEDADGGVAPSPINVDFTPPLVLRDLSPSDFVPGVPTLGPVSPNNQTIDLQWSAVEGATGYRVHYGIDMVTGASIDVGNVTEYSVENLENGETYQFAVSALAQPVYYFALTVRDDSGLIEHESDYSSEVSTPVGDQQQGSLSNIELGIPEQISPFPNLPDEGCFIATATFGSYSAGQVRVLRDFRDRFLLTHSPGRQFVNWYYTHGPEGAHYLNQHPQWKPLIRLLLYPAVALAWFYTQVSEPIKLALLCLLIGALVRSRLNKSVPITPVKQKIAVLTSKGLHYTLPLVLIVFLGSPEKAYSEETEPNWSASLLLGAFYPTIDDWSSYYERDWTTQFSVQMSYRPWSVIEAGVEIGYIRDTGQGYLPLNGQLGGDVTYELFPVDLFINLRGVFKADQWLVPYIGGGWTQAYYREQIDNQDDITGSTGGYHVRVGAQMLLDHLDEDRARRLAAQWGIQNSYMGLEYRKLSADHDEADVDLGGDSVLLSIRLEF